MDQHHKGISLAGRILFLLQKSSNELWGIRNEKVKVPGKNNIQICLKGLRFSDLCIVKGSYTNSIVPQYTELTFDIWNTMLQCATYPEKTIFDMTII